MDNILNKLIKLNNSLPMKKHHFLKKIISHSHKDIKIFDKNDIKNNFRRTVCVCIDQMSMSNSISQMF